MGIIRESFIIFKNWTDAINALPEDYQLETYKALVHYGMEGKIPEGLSAVANAMLISFSVGMENRVGRYLASVENGKKGGRPKKTENLEKPSETKENLVEPNQNLNVNVNDNVNIYKENTLKCIKESEQSSQHTHKHKYGKYKNVLLTEEEYNRLIAEPDGVEAIEFFSEYREMKGYKCKNDNLAIRKWAFAGVKEIRQRENRSGLTPTQNKVSSEEAEAWT